MNGIPDDDYYAAAFPELDVGSASSALTHRLSEAARRRRVAECRRHHEQLEAAIRKYGPAQSGPGATTVPDALRSIAPKNASLLPYMNPEASTLWLDILLDAFQASGLPLANAYMITVIDHRLFLNLQQFPFDRARVRNRLSRGLNGQSYLGMIEFAAFPKRKHDGGTLVSAHFQGIAWGPQVTRDAVSQLNRRFRGGLEGSLGVVVKPITDFAGAVSYGVKLPAYGYYCIPRTERWNFERHGTTELSLHQHFLLWQHLHGLTLPDLTVAGGEGRAVLQIARQMAKARQPPRASSSKARSNHAAPPKRGPSLFKRSALRRH